MIRVDDPADVRLVPYRQLATPELIREAGLFIAEGRLVVRRLLATTRFRTHSVLVTDTAYAALRDVLEPLAPLFPVFVVRQETMNTVAGFNIHRGCLALAERPAAAALDDIALRDARRLIVLEGINNPDNVGGIFRSAAAFAVDAVLLGPACGDPLYRKAIRTSMAGALSVPFADAAPWPAAIERLRQEGLRVVALTPAHDAAPLDTLPRDLARVAVLVGAEGEGLTAEALAAADDRARIPMSGSADSLNVTVAASIALYHFSR